MPEVQQKVGPSDAHLQPQLSFDLVAQFDESKSIVACSLHDFQDGRMRGLASAETLLKLFERQAQLIQRVLHRDCANEARVTDCCVSSQAVSIRAAESPHSRPLHSLIIVARRLSSWMRGMRRC